VLIVQRACGFSLVELLVAIAVVGISLTFASSTLSDVLSNNRIRSTAELVYDALQEGRSEAMKRNATVSVTVSASNAVINYTPGSTCSTASCKTVTFGTATGLSISAGGAVSFSSTGQELNLASHVFDVTNTRCSAEKSCLRVQVNGGGFIKVCNPSQGDSSASNYCA
jgi:type IV fimbrial biogenesis protein FimT